ncbi:MAG UNVERIFIED_CONTAM: hypothetical protein LVR18_41660 [Planctomycetaceae bacterium]|jgi:hypothetical protein
MRFGIFRGTLLLLAVQLPLVAFDAAERGGPAESALALLVLGLAAVWPSVDFHRAAVGDYRGNGGRRSLLLAVICDGVCLSVALITGLWWWVSVGSLVLLSGLAGAIWRQGSLSRGLAAIFLPGLLCTGVPGAIGAAVGGIATSFCLGSVSHAARLAGVLHAVEGGQLLTAGEPLPGALLQRCAASLPLWLSACTVAALTQHRSTAVLLLHQLLALGLWSVLMMGRGVVLLAWPDLRSIREDTLLWLQPQELLFGLAGVGLWLSGDCLARFLASPAAWCGAMPDERRRLNPLTRIWNRLMQGGALGTGLYLRVDGAHGCGNKRRTARQLITSEGARE